MHACHVSSVSLWQLVAVNLVNGLVERKAVESFVWRFSSLTILTLLSFREVVGLVKKWLTSGAIVGPMKKQGW